MPGFVNGHIHLAQVLQRGLSSNHSFGEYFQTIVLRFSNRMTPEDVQAQDLPTRYGYVCSPRARSQAGASQPN